MKHLNYFWKFLDFLTLSAPQDVCNVALSLCRRVPQDVCNVITPKSKFPFLLDISHNISHFTHLLLISVVLEKKFSLLLKNKQTKFGSINLKSFGHSQEVWRSACSNNNKSLDPEKVKIALY